MSEALLFAALLVGAPALKDRLGEGDLFGDWVLEGLTVDGTTVPPGVQPPAYVFGPDGKYFHRADGGQLTVVSTYTLDRAARPMAVDWLPANPGPEARPLKGIIKVQEDRLLMCFAPTAKDPRPTAFASPKGSRDMLNVFKRG